MSKKIRNKGKPRKWLDTAVTVTIIAGVFGLLSALINTTGPALVSRLLPTPTNTTVNVDNNYTVSSGNDCAPSELKEVVGAKASSFSPVRIDFVGGGPAYLLLPDGFDPKSQTLQIGDFYALPHVKLFDIYIDIVGINDDEWARAENFLIVTFDKISTLPSGVLNTASGATGGAGRSNIVSVCWNTKPEEGKSYTSSHVKGVDLFTVAPGERIPLLLAVDFSHLPFGIYTFRVGVMHSYKGKNGATWSDEAFSIAVPDPNRTEDWQFDLSGDVVEFIESP